MPDRHTAFSGCLGNHEEESDTEEYASGLFSAQGIRILRQEQTPIRSGADELNVIGIDCPRTQSAQDEEEEYRRDVNRRVHRQLVMPGVVNVLLSHEPCKWGTHLFSTQMLLGSATHPSRIRTHLRYAWLRVRPKRKVGELGGDFLKRGNPNRAGTRASSVPAH